MGSGLDAIVHVGKLGINDNLIKQVDETLEVRELIKIKVLNTSPIEVAEVAEKLAEATGCAIAQTIGHNVLVYRPSKEKPQIQLP